MDSTQSIAAPAPLFPPTRAFKEQTVPVTNLLFVRIFAIYILRSCSGPFWNWFVHWLSAIGDGASFNFGEKRFQYDVTISRAVGNQNVDHLLIAFHRVSPLLDIFTVAIGRKWLDRKSAPFYWERIAEPRARSRGHTRLDRCTLLPQRVTLFTRYTQYSILSHYIDEMLPFLAVIRKHLDGNRRGGHHSIYIYRGTAT